MNIFQEVFASVDQRTNDLLHGDDCLPIHVNENEDNNIQKAQSLKIERKKEKQIQNFKKFNSTAEDRKTKSFQIKREKPNLIPKKTNTTVTKKNEPSESEQVLLETKIAQNKADDEEILSQIEQLKQQIKQARSQIKDDNHIISNLEKENTDLHAQISRRNETKQSLIDQYNLIKMENEDKIAEMEELLEFQYQEKLIQNM